MTAKRNIIVRLCVSPVEKAAFEQKAAAYQGNVSSMIRDAVRLFDDKATVNRLKVLTDAMQLLRTYQQQFSWLSGNFNQQMKRANELAIAGELTQDYFDHVLLPQTMQVYLLVQSMKDELDNLSKLALRLL